MAEKEALGGRIAFLWRRPLVDRTRGGLTTAMVVPISNAAVNHHSPNGLVVEKAKGYTLIGLCCENGLAELDPSGSLSAGVGNRL